MSLRCLFHVILGLKLSPASMLDKADIGPMPDDSAKAA